MQRIISILTFLWNWAVFSKAGKQWWYSIVPLLNVYELLDIAWMSSLSPLFFAPLFLWTFALFMWWNSNDWTLLWFGLLWIAFFLLAVANYKVARRFWWWVFTSILYVLFNPIAVFILWFWPYNYWDDIKSIQFSENISWTVKSTDAPKSKTLINVIFVILLVVLWVFIVLEIIKWFDMLDYSSDNAFTHFIISWVLLFMFIFLWLQRRILLGDNKTNSSKHPDRKWWDDEWVSID